MFNFFKRSSLKSTLEKAEIPVEFDQVKESLILRLFPYEDMAHPKAPIAFDHVLSDVSALLMIDLPTATMSVTKDQFGAWGKTKEEVFEIAKGNTIQKYPPTITQEEVLGQKVYSFVGFLASTALLGFKEKYSSYCGPKGALILLPGRDIAFVIPLDGTLKESVFQAIAHWIYDVAKEEKHYITQHMLWFHDGEWDASIYSSIDPQSQTLQVLAPDTFQNSLLKEK